MLLAQPLDSLQSPVLALLDSYAAPSPTERTLVRDKVSEIASDLLQLNNEIDRVRGVLEALCRNRNRLQQFSNSHQNVLPSTRRLPVEILGEIFIQWQGMVGGKAIVSTQICRHWRAVAIATSKLWTSIKVPLLLEHTETDVEMTRRWLARSDGQPLAIELGRTHPDKDEDEDHPVFGLITTQAHRWKSLLVYASSPMLSFLQNIPEHLPLLHTLDIRDPFVSETPPLPESLTNFHRASSLRMLSLGKHIPSVIPKFCWAQLTECVLREGGGYAVDECYDVLNQSPNLTSFSVYIRSSSLALRPQPTMRHAKLQCLTVEAYGEDMASFLNLLVLPALRDINVDETATLEFPMGSLISLITRSSCSLTRLTVGSSITSRGELVQLLTLSPMLSELTLERRSARGVDSELLALLTHDARHAAAQPCCLAPKLAALRLSVRADFGHQPFARFLASRRRIAACAAGQPAVVQLRSAEMRVWSPPPASAPGSAVLAAEVYAAYQTLRGQGLDLYVRNERWDRIEVEDHFDIQG